MSQTSEAALREAMIEIAVEAWRFRRVFSKAMSRLDAGEQERYIGQFGWLMKKVEGALKSAGMKIVNLEGQPYDVGMALSPLNIDDFEPDERLYIEQMIEPIIMEDKTLLKMGTAILGRLEE